MADAGGPWRGRAWWRYRSATAHLQHHARLAGHRCDAVPGRRDAPARDGFRVRLRDCCLGSV